MSVQEINNPITGENGVQARVYGRSKYFSIVKYGRKEAFLLAREAEKKLMESAGVTPFNPRGRISSTRNKSGFAGISFKWVCKAPSTNEYACVHCTFTTKAGQNTGCTYSFNRNGVEKAVRLALNKRKKEGYTVPPLKEVVAAAARPSTQSTLFLPRIGDG